MRAQPNWGFAVLIAVPTASVFAPMAVSVADPLMLTTIQLIVASGGWLVAAMVIDRRAPHGAAKPNGREPTIGIVTALPVEGAAVNLFLDDAVTLSGTTDPNQYRIGTMPS